VFNVESYTASYNTRFIHFIRMFADIEWPEDDEALSDNARTTIEALLNMDPSKRPKAAGLHITLYLFHG